MRHRSLSHSTQGVGVQGLLGGQDCHVLDTAGPSWPPTQSTAELQPQWSCLGDSWVKGGKHCLVVKGKKVRNSPESPKGTGRAGDPAAGAGIPLQFPLKVWWGKYSLAACEQDHSRANPPIAGCGGPPEEYFYPKGLQPVEGSHAGARERHEEEGAGDWPLAAVHAMQGGWR